MSSQLASQFDLLGMASPYLLWGKLILQKVATSGVEWDETLFVDMQDPWKKWLATVRLRNDFSIPPNLGVARIFVWGGSKPQIICNNVIKNFRKRNFLWGKDIVKWKIKILVWHLTRILLKREDLNKKSKSENV